MTSQRKWGNALIAIIITYLVFSGNRGLWNLYKLHQQKKNLTDQIGKLKSEIGRSQAQYQVLEKNTSTMEKQAREELNLIKPGEVIYNFNKTEGR
jgi:cell division protein FtsB